MRVAVLIGAGASFGAEGIEPGRPPRGGELFGELERAFPDSWGKLLSDDECDTFRGEPPFEMGMKLLWAKNDERLQPLLNDMGVYFAEFHPNGEPNCYEALIALLCRAPGVAFQFCSLNYECVFEMVAEGMGCDLLNLGRRKRATGEVLTMLKPHGSCNYVVQGTRDWSDNHFEGNEVAMVVGPLEAIDVQEVADWYGSPGSVPPAMCMYEPDKQSVISPDTLEEVQEAWKVTAEGSDVVLAIGARPVLTDRHIWDPVIQSGADVWFVGGKEGAYAELAGELGSRLTHLADKFDQALPAIEAKLSAAA